jgi:hypothetical protein
MTRVHKELPRCRTCGKDAPFTVNANARSFPPQEGEHYCFTHVPAEHRKGWRAEVLQHGPIMSAS